MSAFPAVFPSKPKSFKLKVGGKLFCASTDALFFAVQVMDFIASNKEVVIKSKFVKGMHTLDAEVIK